MKKHEKTREWLIDVFNEQEDPYLFIQVTKDEDGNEIAWHSRNGDPLILGDAILDAMEKDKGVEIIMKAISMHLIDNL